MEFNAVMYTQLMLEGFATTAAGGVRCFAVLVSLYIGVAKRTPAYRTIVEQDYCSVNRRNQLVISSTLTSVAFSTAILVRILH